MRKARKDTSLADILGAYIEDREARIDRRNAYLGLCDELNDDDAPAWNESDWDAQAVKDARVFARDNGYPFPPPKGMFDRLYELGVKYDNDGSGE